MTLAIGRLAFLPAIAFLLAKIANAYAMKTGLKANPMAAGVIQSKFSAQLPQANGGYGSKPAADDVCVFLIGAKNNS